MVDLAQTIEEWKDIQSIKVDDQVEIITVLVDVCLTPVINIAVPG